MGLGARLHSTTPWISGTPEGEACTPRCGEWNSPAGSHGTVAVNDLKAILQAPDPLSSPPRPERALASSPEGTAEGQCPHRKTFP